MHLGGDPCGYRQSPGSPHASYSTDPQRKKVVLSQHVIWVPADGGSRTLQARLLDPRCPRNGSGPPEEHDDPDNPSIGISRE